jgi:lipopolysaccharide biosynthesis regulator YciM
VLDQKKNKDVEIIQQVIKNTIGNKYFHICEKCGFKTKQFHWQCAACNSWDSMTVESEEIKQ